MDGALLIPADEATLPLAVEYLRAGEPLVFPTDTVYGLGALYTDEAAVRKIYQIKGRPQDKPIPLLLADTQGVIEVAKEVPELAWRLMDQFFPGPLTLVLARSDDVPEWVTAGSKGVAVRVPDHHFTRSLIRRAGAPLATSSANLAGRAASVTAQEAYDQIGLRVALIMDGGDCHEGVESTVLDLTGPSPVLLREGAIRRPRLEEVCGRIIDMLE